MSIYTFLSEKSENGALPDGCALPDGGDLCLRPGETWIPGAFEGILLRTDTRIKQHVLVNYHIACAVKRQALRPSDKHRRKMLRLLTKYSAISLADPLCSLCAALKLLKTTERKAALRTLAVDLVAKSEKREPVKIGIALLGICGKEEDMELLRPLGRHDEFTLYVAGTAVRLLQPAARNRYLMDLTEAISGWGKISVLYELDYTDPAVRLWALKSGCFNTVGLSYLANVCATKGRLADVLSEINSGAIEADPGLFKGICDIFTGLLHPNSCNDGLSEYADARVSAERFTLLCKQNPALAETDSRAEEITDGLRFIL